MSTASRSSGRTARASRCGSPAAGSFTWKATAAETGGAFLLLEDRMERGKVTPLHTASGPGRGDLRARGRAASCTSTSAQHRVGAGGLFFAPRGVPHAFMVTSETAHVLSVQTPGNGESFYREAGEPADLRGRSPGVRRTGPGCAQVAERSNCIEILGPPPFATDRA